MTEKNCTDTRNKLIVAAGELFANYGYDGVSIRTIAEKAGVNSAGINYHFGGKDGLYIEVIRYVLSDIYKSSFKSILQNNPDLDKTDAGLAELITRHVAIIYGDIFYSEDPDWHLSLIVREMQNPTIALGFIVNEFFMPKHNEQVGFFKKVSANCGDIKPHVWAFMAFSQALFLKNMHKPIGMLMDSKGIDYLGVINESAQMTARIMVEALGLPLPQYLLRDGFIIQDYL
ncbi:MAG: TetR/AcrR family transcriptional regulator [Gammaproteobacteria bacterium]|nr:MAG: TetR/AcrR family transcriptional regulator [Gammaproteobacteria bacterium]